MTFVPVIPATETPPSPNTQELAGKLSETIREFRQSHPGTKPEEIQHALKLASAGYGSSITKALAVVGLGLLLASGLGLFMFARGSDFDPSAPAFPMIFVALVVLGLLGVMVAFKR